MLKTAFAVVLAGLSSYFGMLTQPLLVLFFAMVLDYLTGMTKAYIFSQLADAEIQEKKRDPTTLPRQSQILLTRGSVRGEDPRFLKGETAESETLSIAFRCSRRMWRSE